MPRPGGGSIGHSKHRKAFGSKQHKSGFSRLLLQRDENQRNAERSRIREAKKPAMLGTIKEVFQ